MSRTVGIKAKRHQTAAEHNGAYRAGYQGYPAMKTSRDMPHRFPDINPTNTGSSQRYSRNNQGNYIYLIALFGRMCFFCCHQLASSLSTSFTQ